MGNQHQRCATLRPQVEQQVDDGASRPFVKIAGRLVSDQQGRSRRECAGQRDALLFAARKLRRVMRHALSEFDGGQFGGRARKRISKTGQLHRRCDVFECGHSGDQMKSLKDDADLGAAKPGQRIFAKALQRDAVDFSRTAVGALEARYGHQERRFARTRWANKANGLATPNDEAYIAQNMHARRAAAQTQVQIAKFYCGFNHTRFYQMPKRLATYGHCLAVVQLLILGLLVALTLPVAWARAGTIQIVALGDSLTAGLGLPAGEAFPEVLEKTLRAKGYDVAISNAGVSGDTAADGLARYDWGVPPGTDALIVELGANDMLRGLDPAMPKASLATVLTRAKAAHLAILLTGMRAAPNMGAEYRTRFDAIYPDLAKSFGIALYPFFLDGVAADPKLNQKDGLHPTREGVEKIVANILPAVEALLAQVKR
jgi:acyl-CoA thioesterase-1